MLVSSKDLDKIESLSGLFWVESGNSMLNYWIKHSSESLRKISFGGNSTFTKIRGLSYK